VSDEPPAMAGPSADAPPASDAPSSPPRRPPARHPRPVRPAHHWSLHPAVVLGSLVLCFPVGFVLVWLTGWDTRSKVIAAAGGMLLAVVLAASASISPPWAAP
jgi:hypothetical protein